jgi:hypothetical protein
MRSATEVPEILWVMFVNIFNFESSFLMMVSAYYGNPRASRSRLLKLWLMVLFYCYLKIVITFLTTNDSFANLHLGSLARMAFPITSGESWFAAGYILIWLLAPYLENLLDNITKAEFLMLISIMAFFFTIMPTFTTYGIISSSGKDVGTLLLFYLIGRYLKKYKTYNTQKLSQCIFLFVLGISSQLALNGIFLYFYRTVLSRTELIVLPFSGDHSFLELLLSIGLLGIATKISFHNRIINIIGKHIFGVLLAEGIVYIPFNLFSSYNEMPFGTRYILVIICYVIITMAAGLIIDIIRSSSFSCLENFVIDKSKKIAAKYYEHISS